MSITDINIIYPATKQIYDGDIAVDTTHAFNSDFFSVYNLYDPIVTIKKFQGARLKAYLNVPMHTFASILMYIIPSNDGGTTTQTPYRLAALYSNPNMDQGIPIDVVLTTAYAQIQILSSAVFPFGNHIHLNTYLISL